MELGVGKAPNQAPPSPKGVAGCYSECFVHRLRKDCLASGTGLFAAQGHRPQITSTTSRRPTPSLQAEPAPRPSGNLGGCPITGAGAGCVSLTPAPLVLADARVKDLGVILIPFNPTFTQPLGRSHWLCEKSFQNPPTYSPSRLHLVQPPSSPTWTSAVTLTLVPRILPLLPRSVLPAVAPEPPESTSDT